MKIRDVMAHDPKITDPDDTLQHAATLMKECDYGFVPVCEDDRLVGVITDRDITVRAIAQGKGPDAKVREVMTPEVRYCFEHEDTEHVARNMAQIQVRRLPVMNRDKRLVGVVSIGDLARQEPGTASTALHGIARPSSQHDQSRAA